MSNCFSFSELGKDVTQYFISILLKDLSFLNKEDEKGEKDESLILGIMHAVKLREVCKLWNRFIILWLKNNWRILPYREDILKVDMKILDNKFMKTQYLLKYLQNVQNGICIEYNESEYNNKSLYFFFNKISFTMGTLKLHLKLLTTQKIGTFPCSLYGTYYVDVDMNENIKISIYPLYSNNYDELHHEIHKVLESIFVPSLKGLLMKLRHIKYNKFVYDLFQANSPTHYGVNIEKEYNDNDTAKYSCDICYHLKYDYE